MSSLAVFWSVSFGHIREAWTKVIQVFTDQWVLTCHIDVVSNSHQGTRTEADTSSSVGYKHSFTAQNFHDTNWESHHFQWVSFVEVETTLKCQYLTSSKITINQFTSVSDYCGLTPVWNVRVVYYDCIFDFFSQFSKT